MDSAQLAAARIAQRRSGSRYAIAEVDDFLDECTQALRARERGHRARLRSGDVVSRRFRSVPFFGAGYDADAVDRLLDEVARELRTDESESANEKAQEAQLRATLDDLTKDLRDRRG